MFFNNLKILLITRSQNSASNDGVGFGSFFRKMAIMLLVQNKCTDVNT